LNIVWEYQKPIPESSGDYKFFSWYISGAQRLQNGNTLITEGATGRIFEVTYEGEIVWEFISPFKDVSPAFGNDVYRAYRVPYNWAPVKN
jgi:hypothetical protein